MFADKDQKIERKKAERIKFQAPRRLLSQENAYLSAELDRRVAAFCAKTTVWWGNKRKEFDRFGVLSQMATYTPMRVYDLPALSKRVNTAFTDGSRVFFDADFFKKLLKAESEGKIDLNYLIAHELQHILHGHLERLTGLDPHLANIAQDVRINIDSMLTFAVDRIIQEKMVATEAEYRNRIEQHEINFKMIEEKFSGDVVKSGYGTSFAWFEKYKFASSEKIAMTMFSELKEQDHSKTSLDMKDVLNTAADHLEKMADEAEKKEKAQNAKAGKPSSSTPSEESNDTSQQGNANKPTANQMRDAAKKIRDAAKGQASKDDLKNISDSAQDLASSEEARNMDTSQPPPVNGKIEKAADLKPSSAIQLAGKVADAMLNPSTSPGPSSKQSGKGEGGEGDPSGQDKAKGKGGNPNPDGKISPDAAGDAPSDSHYVSPEELKDILDRAGQHHLTEALGYDTPEKLEKMRDAVGKNIETAVRNSVAENEKNGFSAPGGHIADSAMRLITELRKPKINVIVSAMNKIMMGASGKRKTLHTYDEVSSINAMSGGDLSQMGFSPGSIPFLGGHMPVKQKKKTVLVFVDTSGSTSGMIHDLFSMAIGIAMKNRLDTAPSIVLFSADTVVRGKPILINEKNAEKLIKSGLAAHGFGGTDVLAPIHMAMDARKRGGLLEKQDIAHIIYMTDGEFCVPTKDMLPENTPPVTFMIPTSHYRPQVDEMLKNNGWSDVVFFSNKDVAKLDLDKTERNVARERRGM